MININHYLKFLNEQTGYLNYVEDRYLISEKMNSKIKNCMHRFNPTTLRSRVSLYKCEINVFKTAITKFERAKEKCQYTKMSDKCEQHYQNIIDELNNKIQFFGNEIPNLLRKSNKTKY